MDTRGLLLSVRCACGHSVAAHDPRCYQVGCPCLAFSKPEANVASAQS